MFNLPLKNLFYKMLKIPLNHEISCTYPIENHSHLG